MDGAAVAVAEYLDLDVARLLQVFLEIDRVVAERGLGLRARGRERDRQVRRRARHLHAAPAAAGGGLHQHRKADVARDRRRVGVGADAGIRARHHRNAEALDGALGLDLVAHQADMLGPRPDEVHAVLAEDFGEARVLRQEAVARMHGVGAGDLAGGEQRRNVEIAVARGRRADAHAFVGKPHVHRVGVGGRMHRDRRNAELLAGAQHPQRDLAAIGDQDLFEHQSLRGRHAPSPDRCFAPSEDRLQRGIQYSVREPSCAVPVPNSVATGLPALAGDDERELLDDHQRFAELDRLGVLEQDLRHGAGARRRESGSSSSSPR